MSRQEIDPQRSRETVYTPYGDRSIGPQAVAAMFRTLSAHRGLMWRLVQRGFTVRYRKSFLGYAWALVMPLLAVAVFAFLSRYRILPTGRLELPYVVFGVWSFSVWQLFSGCVVSATSSLTNAGPLVTKTNFPKETLVFAAVSQPIVDFLVRMLFVAMVLTWYGIVPPWQFVWVPLLLVPVILLGVGVGMALSVLNLVVRDVTNLVGILAFFGMFITPVLYPPPVKYPFNLVNVLNPVSPLLIATQDLLARGTISRPLSFALATLFAIGVFAMAWWFFRTLLPRVVERA